MLFVHSGMVRRPVGRSVMLIETDPWNLETHLVHDLIGHDMGGAKSRWTKSQEREFAGRRS